MDSSIQTPVQKQAARRRLVRGVFAAPAIMTVCSGSAFAAGSSLRCLSNQVNSSTTTKTVGVSESLDTWLRVQLQRTGSGTTDMPYIYYVSGADLGIWKLPSGANRVYLSSNEWQLFNPTSNTAGAKVKAPSDPVLGMKYAALQFDAKGNVVGVGVNASGTSAMPGTCWSSVAPAL